MPIPDPFDDMPDKYARYNYTIGQVHAVALRDLFKNMQILQSRMDEHDKLHVASNRAAMQVMEMPASSDPTKGQN